MTKHEIKGDCNITKGKLKQNGHGVGIHPMASERQPV